MRLTPPRRARRRMAGLVMPWMLSRRTLRWRLACVRRLTPSVSAKDFQPYSKIASEPMGVGALQSKHRFRLRIGRNQKRFSVVFDGFRSAPIRALARVEAALARRSIHPGFARRLWSVRAVKTINGSRLRVP
jgi:hypothetical protein